MKLKDDGIRFYVLHVEPGMEKRVKADIKHKAIIESMSHQIKKVFVPVFQEYRKRKEDGKPVIVNRRRYPGYLILKAVHTDGTFVLINGIRGVLGYLPHRDKSLLSKEEFDKLKASGELNRPVPLASQEAAYAVLTSKRIKTSDEFPEPKFKDGDKVKIIHGIFQGHPGIVLKALSDENFQVEVKILGARTKVECGQWEIEIAL